MDLGLHGKRVLITGGSRGMGLAIAGALAAEGAAVGLIARHRAPPTPPPRRRRSSSRRPRASWITGANVVVDGGQRYPSARRFD